MTIDPFNPAQLAVMLGVFLLWTMCAVAGGMEIQENNSQSKGICATTTIMVMVFAVVWFFGALTKLIIDNF